MRVPTLVFALLVLGGIVWFVYASQTTTPEFPSVEELYETNYVAADDWLTFYDRRRPKGTGWVVLPKAAKKPQFRSDIGRADVIEARVCGECHEDNYTGWQTTAHAVTSRTPHGGGILGSFEKGKNRLETRAPNLHFEMTGEPSLRYYQSVYVKSGGRTYRHRRPIDIVTGSGHHGQSYLYWEQDRLYELPVSYFSALDRWTNSPGEYVDGTADFARPIGERCLDCHATWFAKAPDDYNRYDRTNYVLGVGCVRCHGPGRQHVEYHRANPDATEAKFIVHPSELARERTNVICAQCHSGIGRLLRPAFTYRPGDPLEAYVELEFEERSGGNEDPHAANQLARLRRSKCYIEDESLTCATCHNPHQFERGNAQLFADRCMSCHEPQACKLEPRIGPEIKKHCVACHMPLKGDNQTVIKTASGKVLPQLRDHYIRGWPSATEQVLKALGK